MDIVYTVELYGLDAEVGQVSYRLQRDKRWRLLGDYLDLVDSDYRSDLPHDVIALSPPGCSCLEIDAAVFRINPRMFHLGDNVLETRSKCFRRALPALPSMGQLRMTTEEQNAALEQGLVLSTSGQFELRESPSLDAESLDPTIAVRYPTYRAGHDQVRKDLLQNEAELEARFASFIDGWLYHLKTGWTQIYTGFLAARVHRDSLLELQELLKNWRPQF
ncbi:MAG TPA: hypothetical protein PK668_13025 [Myxococcota bacterium]|nr:hypothetical protein [Myxococcota bacterium]HRY93608.1 hypothetical protein [Myxococcota bacterium]